ncbi:ABC-type transport system ATP-binding protein (probable substrate dipeptide/oligopeptide) [Natronomonas pharaonis DSM 2160]|uniref:ABC-type transport system ATP-binding protein (Probable substrate dipeptide/oligopeptide) n=1 Tax=Natronomonas pharaonis (strain ATCC 35678 / DSM 2160 / CIP 103997 / JCM 8858 / NBRC 14720 / NCIMB 2260 / Gabara) TaxID=348780 RepID=A0A1U7EU54_NATPD|nr:ABC transporter ATP-binding protein [Natronomonas pharaonis]CAI48473.1 ABC-type transport system ATP-binding protein (probable substrate dipeptide/oligopeptide) [Natronomonas pharaonis DSM 2160]
MSETKLDVRDLQTRFYTDDGQVNAVDGVSFTVESGEVFGIVGESGSGKSVTALSLIDLVESPGRIDGGEIWFRSPEMADRLADDSPAAVDGEMVDIRQLDDRERRSLRGAEFATIFQDPMSSFNPSLTVGEQIAEAVEAQKRAQANPRSTRSRTQGYGFASFVADSLLPRRDYVSEDATTRAVELLELVGIPDPADRADEYPHQFSGGMLQRAMIAQALASEPSVLVADEPTTALDVTIQAQVLDLLADLQAETGMTTVLITHNLGVVARMCDRVGVMYAGELVERGTLGEVFDESVHPYTEGLLGSIPDLDGESGRLSPIEGNVPSLIDSEMESRCYFADRCPKAMEECLDKPPEYEVTDDHTAMCYLADHDYDPGNALPEGYFDAE